MKNVNKANAGRTQIADISVAGKELSEEHLRIVAGGSEYLMTAHNYATCTERYGGKLGCRTLVTDGYSTVDGYIMDVIPAPTRY